MAEWKIGVNKEYAEMKLCGYGVTIGVYYNPLCSDYCLTCKGYKFDEMFLDNEDIFDHMGLDTEDLNEAKEKAVEIMRYCCDRKIQYQEEIKQELNNITN